MQQRQTTVADVQKTAGRVGRSSIDTCVRVRGLSLADLVAYGLLR